MVVVLLLSATGRQCSGSGLLAQVWGGQSALLLGSAMAMGLVYRLLAALARSWVVSIPMLLLHVSDCFFFTARPPLNLPHNTPLMVAPPTSRVIA